MYTGRGEDVDGGGCGGVRMWRVRMCRGEDVEGEDVDG